MNKKKIIIVMLISILIIITVLAVMINKTNRISNLSTDKKQAEEIELFSYIVYDNQDEENIKILIAINSENGLEYVKGPNGKTINGNSKSAIFIDYIGKKDEEFNVKIKEINKEAIIETIKLTEDEIINRSISIEKISNVQGIQTIKINNNVKLTGFQVYYKIGPNGNWKLGDEEIIVHDDAVASSGIFNEDNTVTITVKVENEKTGNKIKEISENYEVKTTYDKIVLYDGTENCAGDGFLPWYEYNSYINISYSEGLMNTYKTVGSGTGGVVGGALTKDFVNCEGMNKLCVLYESKNATPALNITRDTRNYNVGSWGCYNANRC